MNMFQPKFLEQSSHDSGEERGTISLGNYKRRLGPPSAKEYNSTFLTHNPSSGINSSGGGGGVSEYNPKPSLSDGKFGKGFNRRQASQIENTVRDERNRVKEAVESRHSESSGRRTEYLKAKDTQTGFNIITGQTYNNYKTPAPEGKKIVGDGLTPYTVKKGQTILKESTGRYHAPLGSGPKFEYRQNVLLNEGLSAERCCSILQLGKKDLKSYGIEDQFSKSEYQKQNEITRNGVYDMRQPGKYTPRKQENNPSGNPDIVKNWTKTIDLNNRSLRGIL